MRLFVEAGGEEQRVPRAGIGAAGAERDRPEPIDGEGTVVRAAQLVNELPAYRVDHIDPSVSKVANQQFVREAPEIGRSDGHAPRRIQPPPGRGTPNEGAVGVEDVDKSL